MRQTDLNPDKDGYYRRNIGFIRNRKGRRVQPKISLGTVKKTAKERLDRIAAMWQRLESSAEHLEDKPVWDDLSLAIAKAIGKGDREFPVSPLQSDPRSYSKFVDGIAACYPEIRVRPEDEELYRAGKEQEEEGWVEVESIERNMLSLADELKTAALQAPGNDRKYVDLLGDQTLHEALDSYSEHIGVEKFDVSEGAVNDTGKKKQDMVKQLKSYLDDQPLQSLTDFASVDRLFGVLRSRPITHRYKKPMARKTATNLMGELSQFLDWLHTSSNWEWRQPLDYHKIRRRPLDLEADGDHETKDVPTYTVAQLKILFEYGTPLERLLILLGVNCAYGADQIGRLRIGEVFEKNGIFYIKRVRKKKRVKGIHRLFDATVDGIRWATRGRESQKDAHVLVNGKGHSLWRKTKGGNRSRDIPNAWYRLLDRLRDDHPEFPKHGFNTLRDTSADMIRRIAGEEVASIHLTHRHQSRDRNLRRYTNIPWKRVFKAQRILERKLAEVFVLDDDPWSEREHQYISQDQVKRMRAMAKSGKPAAQIAAEVGVATTTVYRWVGREIKQAKRSSTNNNSSASSSNGQASPIAESDVG